MIFKGTYLNVSDNSGARIAKCIHVYKKKNYGIIGDMLLVTVRTYNPLKKIKKGELHMGIVIRVRSLSYCHNISLKFSDNAIVLLNKKSLPLGTRLFGLSIKRIRLINKKVFLMLPYVI